VGNRPRLGVEGEHRRLSVCTVVLVGAHLRVREAVIAELVQRAFNDRSPAPRGLSISSQPRRLNVKLIRPTVVTVTEGAPAT